MIVGRKKEQRRLKEAFASDESEFVAVYGRRRVGKTFLIRETFQKDFVFQHSGLAQSDKKQQLKAWTISLRNQGLQVKRIPSDWMEAFELMKELIQKSKKKKKVVFIDELPWMDTHSSGLIPALEHFWNSWASARKDVLLIICGSATSWIINKILKNKGGLHNRIGYKISLHPFSLCECEQYMVSRGIRLTRKQLTEGYMLMGGIPFYWKAMQKGLSLAQNIDQIFFNPEGELHEEFDALYASLFKHPADYIKVVELLAKKRKGLTRNALIADGEFCDNGNFGEILKDLESCGFIRSYNSYGKVKKEALYQLIDPFTFFYYEFIKGNIRKDPNYWTNSLNTPTYFTWCGLSFERVCLLHIEQIKKALGISGTVSNVCSWVSSKNPKGAQIDLLIDREDGVVDLCEMKYTALPWQMDAKDWETQLQKADVFMREAKITKAIHHVLVSANGVSPSPYVSEFQNVLTLDDLFVE